MTSNDLGRVFEVKSPRTRTRLEEINGNRTKLGKFMCRSSVQTNKEEIRSCKVLWLLRDICSSLSLESWMEKKKRRDHRLQLKSSDHQRQAGGLNVPLAVCLQFQLINQKHSCLIKLETKEKKTLQKQFPPLEIFSFSLCALHYRKPKQKHQVVCRYSLDNWQESEPTCWACTERGW